MSKTKSKSAQQATTKADVLSKVKGASVSKPAQSEKVKSKELAKKVATKEDKKDKNKKVPAKEPTPEPSSQEEDDDSSDEESDSEEEVKAKVPAVNGKAKNTKVVAKDESDDSDDSASDDSASEDDDESDEEVAAKTSKPTVKAAVAAADSEADSDEESSDESDSDADEAAVPKVNGAKAAASDDDDASSDDSDSDESEENDDEEVVAKPAKRKADDEDVPAAKKSKVDENAAPAVANLFVGNLSWNIDENWLRSEFEEFGELSGVRVMSDRATGRSKGFGYVEFVNAADAAKAHAAKQGAELDGRAMNVDFANPKQNNGDRQENRRKSYGDQVGEATDTLFLGNLSFECTSDDVTDAFSPHGTIMSVRLPTDRETGAPKGFGYVTFSSVDEASAALEAMQGGYIARRAVRLDYSQPRQNTGDSPARGGFGGRGRGGGGFTPRGRGGGRGDFGGRGRGRGAPRGGRGGSTNRGGFGDFSGRKTTF